ncbi:MAG: DUF58 domain-containing protein [Defluviitaleaceae bacterium]|nr:DUF58 domain-containing protein [Defluviitaleaceae bacterium]
MGVIAVVIVICACVWLQALIYRRYWDKNTSLRLSFSETRATEGDRLFLVEEITNSKLLPLPWLAVKFQVSRRLLFDDRDNTKVSDDFYRNDLFNLLMFQKITRRLGFVCGRRGFYQIKSAELLSGDIIARNKFAKPVECAASLIVYPRAADLGALLTAHRQFLGDIFTKRFIQPDPFTFKGIREYQPWDSLRSVNFNATAKTGELMVNVCDYTISQEIVLLLNVEAYRAFPAEDLYEQAIRLVAALAEYYLENAVPLMFASNSAGSEPIESGAGQRHIAAINESLALIDLSKGINESGAKLLGRTCVSQQAKRRAGREPAYVFVSTHHGNDVCEAFTALIESGAEALWIIPAYRDMKINADLSDRIVRADFN